MMVTMTMMSGRGVAYLRPMGASVLQAVSSMMLDGLFVTPSDTVILLICGDRAIAKVSDVAPGAPSCPSA